MIFCIHSWKIIKETSTPRLEINKIPTCSEYLAERLLGGVTTILWECSKCQKTKKEEVLGI